MVTLNRRSEFDDFSWHDFAQINNVTLGGSFENQVLALARLAPGGNAVSKPITLMADFFNQASLLGGKIWTDDIFPALPDNLSGLYSA